MSVPAEGMTSPIPLGQRDRNPRRLADRALQVQPFRVMEILARARILEGEGRDIVHMEIGEPDFPTPSHVLGAAARALSEAPMNYTPAAGLPELRRAISDFYGLRQGIRISPERIFLTPGASGALMLALSLLVNRGDEVLLADPGYPCYPNFVRLAGGFPRFVPVSGSPSFCLDRSLLENSWSPSSRGIILASPDNPTGTILKGPVLGEIIQSVSARGGFVICDEIYQGLEYCGTSVSALSLSEDVFVINSFSKFFGMTGWRLGWAVVPEWAIPVAERLVQNLFISAPTLSQRMAIHAFDPENLDELECRRQTFAQRREILLEGIERLGFQPKGSPDGAFYVYADCSKISVDAVALSEKLLEHAGVALTPGADFGEDGRDHHLRFCYTSDSQRIVEGLSRIRRWIDQA